MNITTAIAYINKCTSGDELEDIISAAYARKDTLSESKEKSKLVDEIRSRIDKDGYSVDTVTYDGEQDGIKKITLKYNLLFSGRKDNSTEAETKEESPDSDITGVEIEDVAEDQDDWVELLEYYLDINNEDFFLKSDCIFNIDSDAWELDCEDDEGKIYTATGYINLTLHYKPCPQPAEGVTFEGITNNGYEDGFIIKEGKLCQIPDSEKVSEIAELGTWSDANIYITDESN